MKDRSLSPASLASRRFGRPGVTINPRLARLPMRSSYQLVVILDGKSGHPYGRPDAHLDYC